MFCKYCKMQWTKKVWGNTICVDAMRLPLNEPKIQLLKKEKHLGGLRSECPHSLSNNLDNDHNGHATDT